MTFVGIWSELGEYTYNYTKGYDIQEPNTKTNVNFFVLQLSIAINYFELDFAF